MNRRTMVVALALALAAPGIAAGADRAKEQAEVQAGLGFGGQATAATKAGDKGASYQGAISVSPGVWLYQLTGTGLALELTAKGTKYYKDDTLN
jgi:type II secretory pathway pseudopilin PulG